MRRLGVVVQAFGAQVRLSDPPHGPNRSVRRRQVIEPLRLSVVAQRVFTCACHAAPERLLEGGGTSGWVAFHARRMGLRAGAPVLQG